MGKAKKWNADRIVSISAIIVSVATLLMILYQTELMREEQRASVLPSLMIGYGVNVKDQVMNERVWIENRGLGPAFIEKFTIIKEGNVFQGDLFSYFEKINQNKGAVGIKRFYSNFILPANEGRTLYEKNSDSTSKIFLSNYFKYPLEMQGVPVEKSDKAIIEIYYKNVYGDRWKISSDQSVPEALD
jgi:hypothetical protein